MLSLSTKPPNRPNPNKTLKNINSQTPPHNDYNMFLTLQYILMSAEPVRMRNNLNVDRVFLKFAQFCSFLLMIAGGYPGHYIKQNPLHPYIMGANKALEPKLQIVFQSLIYNTYNNEKNELATLMHTWTEISEYLNNTPYLKSLEIRPQYQNGIKQILARLKKNLKKTPILPVDAVHNEFSTESQQHLHKYEKGLKKPPPKKIRWPRF